MVTEITIFDRVESVNKKSLVSRFIKNAPNNALTVTTAVNRALCH